MAAELSFASASLAESATAAPQLASPALAVKAGRQRGLTCGVVGLCEHGRQRSRCKECGGSGICEHGRQRSQCKECGGGGICAHGRHRYYCKDCGGSGICEHGRRRSRCKKCGGGSIREHGRRRDRCKDCGGSSQETIVLDATAQSKLTRTQSPMSGSPPAGPTAWRDGYYSAFVQSFELSAACGLLASTGSTGLVSGYFPPTGRWRRRWVLQDCGCSIQILITPSNNSNSSPVAHTVWNVRHVATPAEQGRLGTGGSGHAECRSGPGEGARLALPRAVRHAGHESLR